jgi:DNA-binding transcriptional ArsR family regulator
MSDDPNIVGVATLIGDRARAEVLTALLGGRALTASELAASAGVTKQTISAHLAKLLDGRLLAMEKQGRHRYYRLADDDVARLLESMMGVAFRAGAVRLRSSPREPALRKARVCYDHLAGELGVLLFERLLASRLLRPEGESMLLTDEGKVWFKNFGIDPDALMAQRRSFCRPCLDWSERRQHLAGALGKALLEHVQQLGWAQRAKGSRVVRFSETGERAFRALPLAPNLLA